MVFAEELGERKIIELILKKIDIMPNMPVLFGDDVSAVDIGPEKLAVIKTDMLVGKTDIPPTMSYEQAARKAIIMNVSDLAAKGVKPTAMLVALGIPRNFTEKDIKMIGKGLNDATREYDAYIIGGDTNEASDLIICCTAFGIVEKQNFLRRSGARPGDFVAVTGSFGKTTSGLKILLEEAPASQDIRNELINTVQMPIARLKEGLALAQTKSVTSSIDSSDGLAWSLHELSQASRVGFLIDTIPISKEVLKFSESSKFDLSELTLYGGEEYELVITVNPRMWNKAKKAVEFFEIPLTRVGTVKREMSILLKTEGTVIPIKTRGWEHFKRNKSH